MWLLLVMVELQHAISVVGHQLDPGGPTCESVGIHCDAGGGLIRDSTLGLTEVVWVGPETRGIYVSGSMGWASAWTHQDFTSDCVV